MKENVFYLFIFFKSKEMSFELFFFRILKKTIFGLLKKTRKIIFGKYEN